MQRSRPLYGEPSGGRALHGYSLEIRSLLVEQGRDLDGLAVDGEAELAIQAHNAFRVSARSIGRQGAPARLRRLRTRHCGSFSADIRSALLCALTRPESVNPCGGRKSSEPTPLKLWDITLIRVGSEL